MQPAAQLTLPATILEAGVDWITATSKTGENKYNMQVLAEDSLHRLMDSGETIKPQKRLGYDGWAAEGFFFGEKEGSAMTIASGHRANDVWRAVSQVSDNVSRLDVQTTVWTYLERPHVAKVYYEEVQRGTSGMIPIKNATYIEGHPNGETVNIGKRASDQSGRVYDKASEGKMGMSRTIWRYEIETRRRAAGATLAHLRSDHRTDEVAVRLVHAWFVRRGITPLFNPADFSSTLEIRVGARRSDTLRWFRDTLSKTVRAQVERHGLDAVVEALGLYSRVNLNPQKEVN